MKKFFYMSNRQSGKTTMAMYEFLKDPENSIFVCPSFQVLVDLKKNLGNKSLSKNIVSCNFFDPKVKNFKRCIFDDYLLYDQQNRIELHYELVGTETEEVICFSSPERLYDKQVFDFVSNLKKEKRLLAFDSNSKLCFQETLVEMVDYKINTSEKMKEDIIDLYNNYLTDPDTVLIHNEIFFNKKLLKMDGVSFFPDFDREFTELKGIFIRDENDDQEL